MASPTGMAPGPSLHFNGEAPLLPRPWLGPAAVRGPESQPKSPDFPSPMRREMAINQDTTATMVPVALPPGTGIFQPQKSPSRFPPGTTTLGAESRRRTPAASGLVAGNGEGTRRRFQPCPQAPDTPQPIPDESIRLSYQCPHKDGLPPSAHQPAKNSHTGLQPKVSRSPGTAPPRGPETRSRPAKPATRTTVPCHPVRRLARSAASGPPPSRLPRPSNHTPRPGSFPTANDRRRRPRPGRPWRLSAAAHRARDHPTAPTTRFDRPAPRRAAR